MKFKNTLRCAAVALAIGLQSSFALAAYPDQPVKIVVPFPAAGSTDLVTRALAVELGAALNQQVVVDNKAGAGSLIGIKAVILNRAVIGKGCGLRGAPDGFSPPRKPFRRVSRRSRRA